MEITYIDGKELVDLSASHTPTAPFHSGSLPPLLPTAVGSLHSQSTEMVGIFHKRKKFHKRKSCLNRLTIYTSLLFSKNHYFTLFSRTKFFFSLLQTTKLHLQRLTTLQHSWISWLAPTMWTLVNAKRHLDEFLGSKILSTTWTCNSKCSGRMKTQKFDWHKTRQWERQTLISLIDWGVS